MGTGHLDRARTGMSSRAVGGVDKRQLEIEMNSTLGDLPKLSTISTSIKDDATEFRTQHPYILALVLILLGLAVGGCVAYTAGFMHGAPNKIRRRHSS